MTAIHSLFLRLSRSPFRQKFHLGHVEYRYATATCCHGCLCKWHNIPQHRVMTPEQQAWVVEVILHWLRQEMKCPAPVRKDRPDLSPKVDSWNYCEGA